MDFLETNYARFSLKQKQVLIFYKKEFYLNFVILKDS